MPALIECQLCGYIASEDEFVVYPEGTQCSSCNVVHSEFWDVDEDDIQE